MFKKKHYKLMIGLVIGIVLSIVLVTAASYIGTASDLSYDNANSGLSSSDVQGAIDELYDRLSCPNNTYCKEYKDTLELGDYVYYKPIETSVSVDTSKTGYAEYDSTFTQSINPSELELWRVLNIYDDGTVDLISEYVSSTDVYFYGQTGYLNFVGYLNELAKEYETEGITLDENGSRYFGYNGQTEYITDTSMFTSTPPFGCSTDGTTGNCSNTTYPNDPDDYEAYGGGDTLYTTDYNQLQTVLGTRIAYKVGTDTAKAYWMASRYYYYSSASNYSWSGRSVSTSGSNSYNNLYYYYSSSFYSSRPKSALRPIVTLKSGLSYGGGIGTEDSPMKIIVS